MKQHKANLFGVLFFLLFTFLIFPSFVSVQGSTSIPEDIKRDYQPLSALVIGLEGNEVILDKGRAQGVRPRDLFTIYKKVKKIIHPETKESLGFLLDPIAKVEILRVQENFSIGRILSKKEDIPIPTPARRFTDQRILIVSEDPVAGDYLFITLKNLLSESEIIFEPARKFQDLTSQELFSKRIDLLFYVGRDQIRVYNAYLDLIRAYGFPVAVVRTQPPQVQPQVGLPQAEPPQVVPPQQTVPYTITFTQVRQVGKMPGEVLQAEFGDLDGDGFPEIVYFTNDGLFIVKIRGGLLARYKPERGEILSFSLGPSGWIALNVYDRNLGMRSEILRFSPQQGLQVVLRNINLFLQFMDFAGTGEKDTLLAQTFDNEALFGKEVYVVKREGNSLRYVQAVEVPEGFRIIGANFIDLDGDGERELLFYLPDGRLAIYKEKKQVFVTPFPVIKHFYQLRHTKGKRGQEIVKAIAIPAYSPLIIDLTGDKRPEILLSKTEFPLERISAELKTVPLNQGNFQLFFIGYNGGYYFRALPFQETGIMTGLGSKEGELFLITVKGLYPGQTESILYSILY